jgi:hypothetical protein
LQKFFLQVGHLVLLPIMGKSTIVLQSGVGQYFLLEEITTLKFCLNSSNFSSVSLSNKAVRSFSVSFLPQPFSGQTI